jgi:UDP-2,3-diacylglucosamine pyrophosphatase LpxH
MKWKTIIMSDLHLGARQSQTDKILSFLEQNDSEKLILNGDIIDGWAMKKNIKWNNKCTKIVKKILKKSKKGTEVIWVRGNHDDFLKDFLPLTFNKIKIKEDYIHIGLDGRFYYVFHGDVLDFVVLKARWLAVIGGSSYDFIIRLNTFYNKVRKFFNLPYHSLANVVKQSVKGAINFLDNFQVNAIAFTKSKGFDVAVCGHIHHPLIIENYMNSGDFCENSTCLVEDFDGKWKILEI